jgi:hypothetical protein
MRTIIIVAIVLLVLVGLGWAIIGRTSAPHAAQAADDQTAVYICRETSDVFRLPRTKVPPVHPQTGRASLVHALYCAECNRWQPMLPDELRDRFPAGPICREHRTPLTRNGPLPEKSP